MTHGRAQLRARQKQRTRSGDTRLGLRTSSDKTDVETLLNAYRIRQFRFHISSLPNGRMLSSQTVNSVPRVPSLMLGAATI